MIEDLIIIIPTHNRQHYLRRVIKYYTEFPCKVYICDSSSEKADVESSGNIVYRWVPQSNFYGKVLDVLNETSAEFYALSPDDDFLKQETLMECYDLLISNNKYVMANGKQCLFYQDFDNKLYYNVYTNGFSNVNEINNDVKGVRYYWDHYQNILWSLFRREAILNAFLVLKKCGFKNGNFIEIVLSIESLRIGSVYISDNHFNCMEINPNDHWGNTTPSISWKSLLFSSVLRNDIRIFYKYYTGDFLAKRCLRLHMGNPFVVFARTQFFKCCGLLVKLRSLICKNIPENATLPIVNDEIMVERISAAFREMK